MSTDAIRLREAVCARLLERPGYTRLLKVYVPRIQPDQVPSIAGYIISETGQPDGDGNAGNLAFVNSIVIGVSIVRGFEDPVFLDGRMDIDLENIATDLFTDPSFVTFGEADVGDDDPTDTAVLFESISQIVSRRLYPQGGETYFAEARLEITFQKRSVYDPNVPDDYAGMTITARPLGKDANTPAITVEIDET